jgi:8-oxo-dGTP diphosphatase
MKIGKDYIGVVVAAVILNSNGDVLLAKRSKNVKAQKEMWEMPGGVVEFCEMRDDALKREVKEELGIDIKILKELCTIDGILVKEKQHWIGITYVAELKGKKQPVILEPSKCDEIGWFSLDKLPRPLSFITTLSLKEFKKQYKDLL